MIDSIQVLKSKRIFLTFYALATLLPIIILFLIIHDQVIPYLQPGIVNILFENVYIGLGIVAILPLLSFFLMYRWLDSLEVITSEIATKTTEVANGTRGFTRQRIEGKKVEDMPVAEENEVMSLIRSFNAVFAAATDQIEERNRLKELLAGLISVSSSLTAELDSDRLFPLIISNVTDAIGAQRTSLYVVDWERREIWTSVAEGVDRISLPLGQGISGRVAETGEIVNTPDAWELPYFDRSFDLRNDFRTRSVLCVPVKNRFGTTIGVLQVMNHKLKERFDEEDEVFLKSLASQVAIALENSLLLDEIRLSFDQFVSTLSAIVDARHPYTAGHSKRVMDYALLIAKEMQLGREDTEILKYAAILHDIGKIGIRDDVLMKNGSFSEEDWAEMRMHPLKTRTILENMHFPRYLRRVPEIACLHHEKINGEGYPYGLKQEQLPIGARILAVADMFDAVTSKRDYPKYAFGQVFSNDPMPPDRVIQLLKTAADLHYDSAVIDTFLQCLPEVMALYQANLLSPAYAEQMIRSLPLSKP